MSSRLLRFARTDLGPLARNAPHRFAANHALTIYRSGAVYSFIPKNACTTLRVSLAMANGILPDTGDWNWIHHNNFTFSASLKELVTAPFTFVVLRCPHARLASTYLDKIVRDRPVHRNLLKAEDAGRDPASMSFRDFVTLLETPRLHRFNDHWRPQVDFLVYEDYDLWVPLERFADHVPRIEAEAGMAVHDSRRLSGHGVDGLTAVGAETPGAFAETPRAALARMRAKGEVPALAALYDDDLVARVARLYAEDGALYRDRFGPDRLSFPAAFSQTTMTEQIS